MVWGEVTPAERLRSITHRRADDDGLAAETADALAAFAAEPASLVVACRRVLSHHGTHGPLWWVCARILAAPDPSRAAHEACGLLNADATADRCGAHLPLLDGDDVVGVIGWSATVDDALAARADLAVVAVRVDGADPAPRLRRRHTDHPVRVVDIWDPVLERVAYALVTAQAIGSTRALVPAGTTAALDAMTHGTRHAWLVGGVGRVLPDRLYERAVLAADDAVEECTLERFDRVAGPRGVERPADAAARIDCPVVPELLRPL
jgi:hypothetical protein